KRVSPDSEVVFVGVGRQMEAKLIDPAGYRRFSLPFTPLLGGGLRGKLRLLYSTPRALVAGMLMLRELKPAVVVGFGGYPSFIPMVSAFLLRIPTVLHEQNVKSGISNRALAFISRHVFTPRKPRGFSRMIKTEEIGVPV